MARCAAPDAKIGASADTSKERREGEFGFKADDEADADDGDNRLADAAAAEEAVGLRKEL